jgi:hypothetical protein
MERKSMNLIVGLTARVVIAASAEANISEIEMQSVLQNYFDEEFANPVQISITEKLMRLHYEDAYVDTPDQVKSRRWQVPLNLTVAVPTSIVGVPFDKDEESFDENILRALKKPILEDCEARLQKAKPLIIDNSPVTLKVKAVTSVEMGHLISELWILEDLLQYLNPGLQKVMALAKNNASPKKGSTPAPARDSRTATAEFSKN